jgi:hypothetical protein
VNFTGTAPGTLTVIAVISLGAIAPSDCVELPFAARFGSEVAAEPNECADA